MPIDLYDDAMFADEEADTEEVGERIADGRSDAYHDGFDAAFSGFDKLNGFADAQDQSEYENGYADGTEAARAIVATPFSAFE